MPNYELEYYNLEEENMSAQTKSVLKRFLKGFVSGAIATMVLVPAVSPVNFNTLKIWLLALLLAGIFGGVNGLILALQKWASWKN